MNNLISGIAIGISLAVIALNIFSKTVVSENEEPKKVYRDSETGEWKQEKELKMIWCGSDKKTGVV